MILKVFYKGRIYRTRASGEYDTDTKEVKVYKGSVVSNSIAQFKGAETIKRLRDQYINTEGVLLQDVTFKSPSQAAKFVSGFSTNGLLSWHVENHKVLKTVLQEMENEDLSSKD